MAEDRSREESTGTCSACGAPLAGAGDRSYGLPDEAALCWSCGIERGGEYDADTDRWVVAPRVADLDRSWRPRD